MHMDRGLSMRHIVAGPRFARRLCAAARLLLCGYSVAKMSQRAARAICSMCSRFALALMPASRAAHAQPAARLRGSGVAALLRGALWVPDQSSMPIVRDPPTPFKIIGVPQIYPLDLDLDPQGW
jgi:hypothetical protein